MRRPKTRKIIALVTATVSPRPEVPDVAIADPEVRVASYREGLTAIVDQGCFDAIVFAENSGYLRTEGGRSLKETERFRSVFFADVDLAALDHRRGKGFLEGQTVRLAIEAYGGAGDDPLFCKVTGRYRFVNARRYVDELQQNHFEIAGVFRSNLKHIDTRVFAFTRTFFDGYIAPRLGDIDDRQNVYIEDVAARAAHAILADTGTGWYMPQCRPRFFGVSGSTGKKLGDATLRVLTMDAVYAAKRKLTLF